ncbi:helix-turn-helix domain-containing protein [Streptomyces sp. NPDC006784]|uniref:helix-turn-helix domain-containing protein n=1 Tax=Streptomyces sp. NPDC006784 TaxID=3364764 RepID=UPI003687DDF2
MVEDKRNPLGPTGEHVRANVERLRKARGMNKKDLSEAVAAVGRPIPPLGVSRLEAGARRVDADDLVAVALALNVSPVALLMPPDWGDDLVSLTPTLRVGATTAWRWAEGKGPATDWGRGEVRVGVMDDEDDAKEREFWRQREEYEALTHPPERRRAAQHPLSQTAEALSGRVSRLVGVDGGDPDTALRELKRARATLAQLTAALDQFEVEQEELQQQTERGGDG